MEKVLCSSKGKQQTRIKSREDLTSVIVTLILLVNTLCDEKRVVRRVLLRERNKNTARTFEVWQLRSEEQRVWSVWLARISCRFYWVRSEIPTRRSGGNDARASVLRNKQLWGTHLDKLNHIFPVRELFLMFKAHRAIDVNRLKISRFQRALRT